MSSAVRPPGGLLAALPRDIAAAVVRDGDRTVLACGAEEIVVGRGEETFARLAALGPGLWVGFLAYDLGRQVEQVLPRAPATPSDVRADAMFVRFSARVELGPGGDGRVTGRGEGRRALEGALATVGTVRAPQRPALGEWRSSLTRAEYEAGVRIILELIRAGECYQANLTRRLSTPTAADPVALWEAIVAGNPAPHATFLRAPGIALVSASPERFLRVDGRAVETRPIKGTARRADALAASAKDHAENVMIVDLARNDLGRVCEPGSIHVPALCAVEEHPGLAHLVSTVRGTLRGDVDLGDLVRATFPPASVTGAPKPRVLQVIEDLEPARRGVYCGALGWIDTERNRADLAVAIRTFVVTAAGTELGVGAGITVDSDPAAEWAETELKASRLLALAGLGAPDPARAVPVGA